MRQYMVEILRISSFLMVFFYRRFLPLDVFIYAFGAENDASSSNLPIPSSNWDLSYCQINLNLKVYVHNC